jgi:uncharacterized protein
VRVVHPIRELMSKAAWRLNPDTDLGLKALKVSDGNYVTTSNGSKTRCMAFFRVVIPDLPDDPRHDYSSGLRTTLQVQRMRGLFEGLRRATVPFVYLMLTNEAEGEGQDPLLEFDLAVGTWVDVRGDEEAGPSIEQRASILSATLSVAIPTANVLRLARGDLVQFAKSFLMPGEKALPQRGSSSVPGAFCSFEELSPVAAPLERAPDYYVPNAAESGSGEILLGAVKSGGREFHDFRLRIDDLKKHVSILGATGSGKSTTTGMIVAQVAGRGLPTLVLDWHNEYGETVAKLGGNVVCPGKDDFSVNPLEGDPDADPVEHVAMVSDIFSDIYHFTHPQAYMFRNALQKSLTEASSQEIPTISTLVRAIEAYPLRSAYDNETKVALLRRLVPLTQGHSGKALGPDGPAKIGELLKTVTCIELGHMRDVQSRAVFSDVILKLVYEEKVKRKDKLNHLTIVEEARNIAPARRPEDPPSVGERMASELRKFGEGMIFVAQFPSHVAAEVIKNSGTKIVHRLGWPDDVSLIGDSMGLNQKQREHLARLQIGEAVIGLERIQSPLLVKVRPVYSLSTENRDRTLSAVP